MRRKKMEGGYKNMFAYKKIVGKTIGSRNQMASEGLNGDKKSTVQFSSVQLISRV